MRVLSIVRGALIVAAIAACSSEPATSPAAAKLSLAITAAQTITIDAPAQITRNGGGDLRITVFGEPGFDVQMIDLSTACISGVCADIRGKSGEAKAQVRDVDKDGDLDLVLWFSKADLVATGVFDAPVTELHFTATLFDGTTVEGWDVVEVK